MDDLPLITLVAASPDELNKNLTEARKSLSSIKSSFVSVILQDPQIRIHPFHFKDLPAKDLPTKLMFEAVSFLSLPAAEIQMDYQVLHKNGGNVDGVLVCMPNKRLHEYLKVIQQAKCVAFKITAQVIAKMDVFLSHYRDSQDRLCFLDFCGPGMIHLAVFHQKRCELLREVHYDNLDEIRNEVIQSLRSVCGKSFEKKVGHICCSGDMEHKAGFLKDLEEYFHLRVEQADANAPLKETEKVLSLNLLRRQVVSVQERSVILNVLNALVVVTVAGSLYLSWQNFHVGQEIKKVRGSYNKNDYEYAKKLQQQFKSLGL